MADLLRYEDFLQPAEREEAFRPLRVFLEENIKSLRNTTAENYSIMRPKISHWIDSDWYLFFNNLPHEFYDTKTDITTWLINIGVEIQKSHRRDCKKMSKQLISLQDTPESLRTTIVSNHAAYTGSSSYSGNWKGGFWIFWVILMLIRAISSNGCGENKNQYRQNIPVNFKSINQVPDSSIKLFTDSILRMNRDSILK